MTTLPAPPRPPEHPARGARRDGIPGPSLRIATIAGVDVRVHASWLAIAALVTWSLATGYFPGALPGSRTAEQWLLGAVAALLLFASVLVHEMAHSVVARARGVGVTSITLFLFGGVSNLSGEAKDPGTEFRIAIVGPLTSFAIGIVSIALAFATSGRGAVGTTALYLGAVNLALGVFNLIPGFPLDGGRVLRSVLWSATDNLPRATRIATTVSQIVGALLMVWGVVRIVSGDILGGIWIAAIGWFLQSSAQASLQQLLFDARLGRLRVRDVIRPDTSGVAPTTTVADLIDRFVLPGGRRAVPVLAGGRMVGLVTLSDIRDVPIRQRPWTRAEQVMTNEARLVSVSPATPLRDAVGRLGDGEFEQLPVLDHGQLVGLLTRADVIRELRIREELGLAETDGHGPRTEPPQSGGLGWPPQPRSPAPGDGGAGWDGVRDAPGREPPPPPRI